MKVPIVLAFSFLLWGGASKSEDDLRRELAASEAARLVEAKKSAALIAAVERLTVAIQSGKNAAMQAAEIASEHADNAQSIANKGVADAANAEASRKQYADISKYTSDNQLKGVLATQRTVLWSGALLWAGGLATTVLIALLNFKLSRKIEVNTNSMSERLQALSLEKGRKEGRAEGREEIK